MTQETILIVDDSSEFAQTVTKYMLTPLGYSTLYAANGQIGLDTTIAHQPDLIISDINMPCMNGMEMLYALRQDDCQIPVIFMTMHGSESVAVEAFRLGVRDYLIKPFTIEEVTIAVNRVLQETRLAREKESLARDLIASEAVRQTAITLAHYVNNRLMVLTGGLALLEESVRQEMPNNSTLLETVHNSRVSATQIGAIIRVLQRVTKIQQTSYNGSIQMLDIEIALQEELAET